MNGEDAGMKAQIRAQKKASREGLALLNVHAGGAQVEAGASYLRSLTAMAALP
jgi:hypothetical protein